MKTTLTPNMKKGIEYRLAHPNATSAEVAEYLGCHPKTVDKWKYHELYQEEWNRRLKEEWSSYRASAQKMMKRLSDNGDFQATKYILDANGYQLPQQIEVNTNTIKISIDENE